MLVRNLVPESEKFHGLCDLARVGLDGIEYFVLSKHSLLFLARSGAWWNSGVRGTPSGSGGVCGRGVSIYFE